MIGQLISEEQCGFKVGEGCGDQIFALKQMNKKRREKEPTLFGFYRLATSE